MVERGSIPYSPDIHPLPELRKNAGTVSSTDAVQMTRVLPISISAEPSAVEMKSGTMLTGRICSGVRLSLRKIIRGNSNSRRQDHAQGGVRRKHRLHAASTFPGMHS